MNTPEVTFIAAGIVRARRRDGGLVPTEKNNHVKDKQWKKFNPSSNEVCVNAFQGRKASWDISFKMLRGQPLNGVSTSFRSTFHLSSLSVQGVTLTV